jgi:hypothetical protein
MVPWTGRIKRYTFAGVAVNASDITRTITGPKNKAGRLWDYGVQSVTTTFAGATSTPHMKVGKSGTLAAYGVEYDFSTLATTGGSKSPRTDLLPEAATWRSAAFVDADIPANTIVFCTMVAATGGGAAGVADFFAEIIWAD